jgi:DNA-binding HxlR family transcriptional regulator
MELDRKTMKLLTSESKVGILKKLEQRKKTPSELSKELRLAPSTTAEHLKHLESSGLVNRVETGHKWIYYELSANGRNIIKPKQPVQFMLILTLGILMVAGSSVQLFYTSGYMGGEYAYSADMKIMPMMSAEQYELPPRTAGSLAAEETYENLFMITLALGIVLAGYGIWKLKK